MEETVWPIQRRTWDLEVLWQNSQCWSAYSAKHLILLDKSHYLSTLLIRRQATISWRHKSNINRAEVSFGQSEGGVLSDNYWKNSPSLGDLKESRTMLLIHHHYHPFCVDEAPPFTHTGMDFVVRLLLAGKDKRTNNKALICLFTCCSMRAVHLDVVHTSKLQHWFLHPKCFTAHRGTPS